MTHLDTLFQKVQNGRFLEGSFHPHAYAIGLPDGQDGLQLCDYPLKNFDPDGELRKFRKSIGFIHELTHFSQYICSSVGLEMARLTNIVQNILLLTGPFSLPLMKDPTNQFDGEQLDRLFAYLFISEAMIPNSNPFPLVDKDGFLETQSFQIPTSPAVSMVYGRDEYPGEELALEVTQKCRQRVIWQTHCLTSRQAGKGTEVVLNTAALMEGFAFATEVHHISNALECNVLDFLEHDFFIDRYPPIYTAAFEIFLGIVGVYNRFGLTEFAAVIDLALMHSPHILHNIGPTHAIEANGDLYRMPAENFITACQAAKAVTAIRSLELSEIQRFQDDIAEEMGILTTLEMTDRCLSHLANVGVSCVDEAIGLEKSTDAISSARLFAAHWKGLNYRRQNSEGFFVKQMLSDGLADVFEMSREICTFFNSSTKSPVNLSPNRISHSSLPYIFRDAFYRKRLECPLKFGRPFFCPNHNKDADTLCVFHERNGDEIGEKLGECTLDLVERQIVARSEP